MHLFPSSQTLSVISSLPFSYLIISSNPFIGFTSFAVGFFESYLTSFSFSNSAVFPCGSGAILLFVFCCASFALYCTPCILPLKAGSLHCFSNHDTALALFCSVPPGTNSNLAQLLCDIRGNYRPSHSSLEGPREGCRSATRVKSPH